MTDPSAPSTVVCFGELLWDCLPRGLFVGGAPINAAYHLHRQGLRVLPVSAVGRDFLGDEALRRVARWGLDPRFITRHRDRPTGIVTATLDGRGIPTYRIVDAVAWDRLAATPALLRARPAAIVHGTLALRHAANRRRLSRLLAAWPDALRIVDLNLREPFDSARVTAFALASAQLVKLNDHELARLAGRTSSTPAGLEKAASRFARQHGITRICVTAGARGAGLWWDGVWFWEPTRKVEIRDTIGAGDAFLGGLLGALLMRRASPPKALAQASRLAEFVASRDGATPPYTCDTRGRPRDASS